MGYEVEAVAENGSALPKSAPLPEFRQERVLDPYRQRKAAGIGNPAAKPPGEVAVPANASSGAPLVGQGNTNGATPGEESKPTAAETVTLSPQVAALARKEQKFRQRELELSQNLKALEAERAELAELKALKAQLAAKDYSGIEKHVDYEQYAQYLLNKQASEDPTQKALDAIRTEVTDLKNAQKSDVEKRFNAAVAERKTAISKLFESDEKYSHLKALKLEDTVLQHILDTWEHDSEELTPEQAAQEIQDELSERAEKLAPFSKLKMQASPTEETAPLADAPPEKKVLPPMKQGLKTLTNQVTAPGGMKAPLKPLSLMNQDERYAEARRRAMEKLSQRPPKSSA